MAKYNRIGLAERIAIEEGLDRGDSINEIAKTIRRSPSSVMREIASNRTPDKSPSVLVRCFDRKGCRIERLCGEDCDHDKILCKLCPKLDCRRICGAYIEHCKCEILEHAPYVCNRCKQRHYRCGREGRYRYVAKLADALSKERRSSARCGIDMTEDQATHVLACIKEGFSRGLSPYEISVLYEPELGISRSTIYRWVEAGYGGLTNLELERKVRFRPRRKGESAKATSHSKRRSYEAFSALDDSLRAAALEMDTMIGRNIDKQALLTLYHRPSDLQLVVLLETKSCEAVKRELLRIKKIASTELFERLFALVLTDNGEEFADEDGIGFILGEGACRSTRPKLYYCDVRASQQKGSCEKNHSEVRQILKKGLFIFDELTGKDLSVVMSHANSNPREGLCGMSPIQMFIAGFGREGQALLEAFGIHQVDRDELNLIPDILDAERKERGEELLTRLK